MDFESIEVESYSGYKANERPEKFEYQESLYRVIEITDRWYEGGYISGRPVIRYYKVKTESEDQFLVRYDPAADEWSAKPV